MTDLDGGSLQQFRVTVLAFLAGVRRAGLPIVRRGVTVISLLRSIFPPVHAGNAQTAQYGSSRDVFRAWELLCGGLGVVKGLCWVPWRRLGLVEQAPSGERTAPASLEKSLTYFPKYVSNFQNT